MKSPAWAPGSQRDDTREMREHSVPPTQEISGAAAGARTTWKPALGAGARTPRAPQRQQGRLDQACFAKAKHKAVQPELEGMPKRCHLQSVAANGTALRHVPQPSKGYTPSHLGFHLWSPLGSFCHLLHCICARPHPVSSPNLRHSHGDPSTPVITVSAAPRHITWISAMVYRLFESMKEGFHQLS